MDPNPLQAYAIMAGLIVLAVVMLAAAGWAMRWPPWRLKEVAKRLGGRLVWDGWWHYSEAEWTVEGLVCRLSVQPPGRYQFGHVRVRFKRPCPGRLRLFPERGLWNARIFFGAQDLQIGDRDFDPRFVIQADDAAWARRVLTFDIRTRLLRLYRIEPFSLDVGPAGIIVRAGPTFADQRERLQAFIREALSLVLEIHRVLDPQILITAVSAANPGTCLVCGSPVESEPCHCGRCGTIHHLDCWNYVGGCAVFACAGRPRRMQRRGPVRAA